MRIAQVRLIPYCLPLKRPWLAAATTLTERRGFLVALTTADGITGVGDCAPLPSSGLVGHTRIFEALQALAPDLGDHSTEQILEQIRQLSFPEIRWAVETALCDCAAQLHGVPLMQYLGGIRHNSVLVNAALGALHAGSAKQATAALASGFRCAKIKVGVSDIDTELAALRAIHGATEGKLPLRLDANRAFNDADARHFLDGLANLSIEAIEEPLARPTPERLATLQASVPFAIAVDESLPELGLPTLIDARAMRRLVVKPARIGGMVATQALVRQALAAGIEVVLTSVVDSAVGVTAAAHLAAALSPGLAHGLATLEWLATDVAPAPPIRDGQLWLGTSPGLGLQLFDQFA